MLPLFSPLTKLQQAFKLLVKTPTTAYFLSQKTLLNRFGVKTPGKAINKMERKVILQGGVREGRQKEEKLKFAFTPQKYKFLH
jgi:hypothetical protein